MEYTVYANSDFSDYESGLVLGIFFTKADALRCYNEYCVGSSKDIHFWVESEPIEEEV